MEGLSRSTVFPSKHLVSVWDKSVAITYLNDSTVHVKVPEHFLANTIVPGIAADAEVELVLLKDHEALSENLHLLGTRWLADILNTKANAWLLELVNSSILMQDWTREDVWVAVPLERKNKQEYCMPMVDPESNKEPLMNCGTAIIADQFSNVAENTLTACSNSLAFLMGKCKLGCSYCSIGLGNVTSK